MLHPQLLRPSRFLQMLGRNGNLMIRATKPILTNMFISLMWRLMGAWKRCSQRLLWINLLLNRLERQTYVRPHIRFWAKKAPESALEATVALLGESIKLGSGGGSYVLPTATATRLGGVKVGEGLQITEDGTISTVTDFATSDDMEAMLEEAFNEKS